MLGHTYTVTKLCYGFTFRQNTTYLATEKLTLISRIEIEPKSNLLKKNVGKLKEESITRSFSYGP